MNDGRDSTALSLYVGSGQPLIGMPGRHDGAAAGVVRYFADEAAADAESLSTDVEDALKVFGAWSDLHCGETQTALDRIRHQTPQSGLEGSF